ncbi:MAG TPA: sugar phosphate isomerase/epimerase family protein [Armatimonadota bacterium]
MPQPIIMHINYCEQGQTIAEVCKKAVDWGFDGVEFRRKRYDIEQDEVSYLDELAKGVEASGLRDVLFGYPTANLMTSDKATRESEVEGAIKFFRMAADRFKLTVVNAFTGELRNPDKSVTYEEGTYEKHGSYAATDDHYQWAAEGFKVLGDVAQELGFKFAFELHMGYLHDNPVSAKKLCDMVDRPAVGANLDFGNVVYYGEHPTLEESINLLSPKLYYVHLKNSVPSYNKTRIATALSEGEINHREYLRLLDKANFQGSICIEDPRSGDREWFAQQDLAYIKSLL